MTGVLTCACNYALFAVVAGFLGSTVDDRKPQKTLWSGIAFLAGVVITMAAIGALFGFSGMVIGASFGSYWYVAAGLMCIFFGLYSMDFLPFRLPEVKIKAADANAGYFSAIIFGLTVGGISTAFNTCCNPVFPVILAASFIKGSMLWGLLMLSVFALGFALPLALGFAGIRLSSGRLSKSFNRMGTVIKYAGGILLIIMGFYFLYKI
jgi:cytochrome c biogenesis protein CcdA